MEVSDKLYKRTYCVSTLYGRMQVEAKEWVQMLVD